MHKTVLFCFVAMTFAGCLNGGSGTGADIIGPAGVATHEAMERGFYELDHRGGSMALSLASGNEASIHLFDPTDRRLGRVDLSSDTFSDEVRLENLEAGPYAIFIEHMNGTLAVESRGDAVEFLDMLPYHMERHVIAERPLSEDPLGGVLPGLGLTPQEAPPLNEQLSLSLLRAPTFMHILASGNAQDLHVRVTGEQGTALDAQESFVYTREGMQGSHLTGVFGEFRPSAAPTGQIEVDAVASQFEGLLLLEAFSFSRFQAANLLPARLADEEPAFTYGELPGEPVAFRVHDRAESLYLWTISMGPDVMEECTGDDNGTAHCEEVDVEPIAAWAALFGPDDERLGVYRIPGDAALEIPVSRGGEYVAVPLDGIVKIGADRIPIDFTMNVLDTERMMFPESVPGSSDAYATERIQLPSERVYRAQPAELPGQDNSAGFGVGLGGLGLLFYNGCSEGSLVRLSAGNETVAFWGETVGFSGHVFSAFADTVDVSARGDDCETFGVEVSSYVR